ncbi:MAG: tRNA (adenosine(37)-N6)-dimethylallyltransferase MiaA [Candidatus Cloacimonadota bacterium]|nr:MAG: tRNA (adenosine(37)-N6)-dimethylallyltransferase MiaA [Candidatus Cloacimonadota bacterium]PIE78400.1 MAG: tRNA (adenosine(37)-N6)-dimethylallyltransferase MiaA [Candidatus Delongbacteria bacterium]
MESIKDLDIPIIVGPTASGKTEIAIRFAEKYGYEIISADSRQFFKEMNIGTAKQSNYELSRAKHHFVNFLSPLDESYNSYTFGIEGRELIKNLKKNGKKVLVVGGSGLYIQSLVHGFFDDLGISDEEKLYFRKEVEKRDIRDCFEDLLRVDEEYALSIPKNNVQRIHRGLEVYYLSGRKMSELHKEHKKQKYFNPIYIGLSLEREELYNRINERFDTMLKAGLIDEIRFLSDKYGIDLKRLNTTIGYREFIPFLKGKIDLEEAIHNAKRDSRHFAKRQITWFKRIENMNWVKNSFETIDKLFGYKF